VGSWDDEFKISLFLYHFYNLEKSPWNTTDHDVLLLVCLSLCSGRRLSSHNSTETFGSHCTIDAMLWLIDHVLVSFVTIATTGTIFSLQFTKNHLAAGLCPDPLGELECFPRPSRKTGGLLLRGGERRGGKGVGWEWRRRERRGEEGTGGERRERKGRGRGEKKGEGRDEGPPNANSWIRPWSEAIKFYRPGVKRTHERDDDEHEHCHECKEYIYIFVMKSYTRYTIKENEKKTRKK